MLNYSQQMNGIKLVMLFLQVLHFNFHSNLIKLTTYWFYVCTSLLVYYIKIQSSIAGKNRVYWMGAFKNHSLWISVFTR